LAAGCNAIAWDDEFFTKLRQAIAAQVSERTRSVRPGWKNVTKYWLPWKRSALDSEMREDGLLFEREFPGAQSNN